VYILFFSKFNLKMVPTKNMRNGVYGYMGTIHRG
jgi:hypothetical protein